MQEVKTINPKKVASVPHISTSNITIYVDNVNGNDITGNGSSSAPYATFNRAMQDVGEFYNASVTIVLKKSNTSYGVITTPKITLSPHLYLTIQGEFNTIVSGTISAFNNSVNDPTYGTNVTVARITDSTKNWITDQYKYKLLRVYKNTTSYYRIITNNDTTNLYCSYTFPVTIDNTWSYEILDWGTKVDAIDTYQYSSQVQLNFLDVVGANARLYFRGNTIINACRFTANLPNNIYIECAGRISFYSCLIDNRNNNSVGTILTSWQQFNAHFVIFVGTILLHNDNTPNSAIVLDHGNYRFTLRDGSRILKPGGTYDISGISALGCNVIIFSQGLGKPVIDVKGNGLWVDGFNYIFNDSHVYIQATGTPFSIIARSFTNRNRLLTTNLGVAITSSEEPIHSRFICKGSIATQVTTVTANITLGTDHHIVLVNASGGSRTITLPSASGITGRQYIIKKIDSSANTVTISAQSGQTIDGQASVVLNTQYQFIGIVSDGNNWYRIE